MTVLENTFAERMIGGRVTGQYARTRIQLPPGINYGVSLPTLNPDDQNSVVNVLFQVRLHLVGGTCGYCIIFTGREWVCPE